MTEGAISLDLATHWGSRNPGVIVPQVRETHDKMFLLSNSWQIRGLRQRRLISGGQVSSPCKAEAPRGGDLKCEHKSTLPSPPETPRRALGLQFYKEPELLF